MFSSMSNSLIPNDLIFVLVALAAASSINAFMLLAVP
jgi:hypothetical protein